MAFEFDRAAVPEYLASARQWLIWKFVKKAKQKKPSKMPYYTSGFLRGWPRGKPADDKPTEDQPQVEQGHALDREALVSLDDALEQARKRGFDGVGFAFLPGDGLIGIDLDDVISVETGEIKQRAQAIIDACASFTEISPSGTGVHIILKGETKSAKSNDIGVEMFCGRQFFTFSTRRWAGTPETVNPVTPGVLERLHKLIESAKEKRAGQKVVPPAGANAPVQLDVYAKVKSALAYVSPDLGYMDWLAVGGAIYAELGPGGYAVYDQWCAGGQKYAGAKETSSKWKSFDKFDGGAGALYKKAMDAGWRPPKTPKAPRTSPAQQAAAVPAGEAAQQGSTPGDGPAPAPPGDEPPDDDDWTDKLLRNGEGVVKAIWQNVAIALMGHPQLRGLLAVDLFQSCIVCMFRPPWLSAQGDYAKYPREWIDDDDYQLGMWLATSCYPRIVLGSPDAIRSGVNAASYKLRIHPLRSMLEGLKWDGVPRLNDWIGRVCKPLAYASPENGDKYFGLVGRYMLISMVARVMRPGCKVDNAAIFEGGQGQGKSSLLEVLAGSDYFADTPFVMGDTNSYLALRGKWLYEIAELDSFNRAEATRAKAFMSSAKDTYRAPYERRVSDHMRQCIFAASTNADEYFKDPTGNRRYWPVKCLFVDLVLLAELREQLLAEAFAAYRAGERWWPNKQEQDELFTPEQEAREIGDSRLQVTEMWLNGFSRSGEPLLEGRRMRVTTAEILFDCWHVEYSKVDGTRSQETKAGQIMAKLGWAKKRETGATRGYYFARPPAPPAAEPKRLTEPTGAAPAGVGQAVPVGASPEPDDGYGESLAQAGAPAETAEDFKDPF